MAVFSESEQVVVRVYSMLLIAVDIETVCESDPLADVKEPVIEQVLDGVAPANTIIVPLTTFDTVADTKGAVLVCSR